MTKLQDYLKTYAGRELMKRHSLDDEGTWEVLGEDPNCDWGGHHYQPRLGVFTGKLRDILEMAVEMGSFWTWGAGGNINLLSITKVDASTVKKRLELTERERQLKEELADVQQAIKSL